MKRYAVAWTGGKDCALALRAARSKGMDVCRLVTFASPEKTFFAHSLDFMAVQARSLKLPHDVFVLEGDYATAYRNVLTEIKAKGCDGIITGDIDFSKDGGNWMQERCDEVELELILPLWQLPRVSILERLIAEEFHVVFSAVKESCFSKDWLGRRIDANALEELKVKAKQSIDICGECGCYHSMTLDSPDFSFPLQPEAFIPVRHKGLWVMERC